MVHRPKPFSYTRQICSILHDEARTAPARPRWKPVRRKPRCDGWTPQRQRAFIAALAESGCIEHAARAVGISARSCYRLRRARGAAGFAAAWNAALQRADHRQRMALREPGDAPPPARPEAS